ncbi:MAG TPA: SDR family oxidoreductase [Bacteroidota bacterium]|nr:SDR family oxidoreductase [Bacteroidota bacterium]
MESLKDKIVFITGASSGIGEACAKAFAREGAHLLMAARREERLRTLGAALSRAHPVRVHSFALDVRDQEAVSRAIDALPEQWRSIDILINNAGLSRGLDKVHEGSIQDWEEMIDTNVKGLLYVTRAVLPSMARRKSGHVINLGSIAGHQLYPNGNVYCATKHAVKALSEGLRMDLLGTNIRVSSVDPGLVETEFSRVRFHGDVARAAKTYENMRPLLADDIAEVILFCATRPAHVDLAEVIVMPTDQASVNHVYRGT